jgi:hypothetical protein
MSEIRPHPSPLVHGWTIVLLAMFLFTALAHLLVMGANDKSGRTDTFNFGWPLIFLERDANLQWDESPRFTWFAINDRRIIEFSLYALSIDVAVFILLIPLAVYSVESTFRSFPGLGRLSVASMLAAVGFIATIVAIELNRFVRLPTITSWQELVDDLTKPWQYDRIWWLLRIILIGAAWFGGVRLAAVMVNGIWQRKSNN